MSTDNQKKEIIEQYINSYNMFDIEGMLKNLDINIIFENISDGNVNLTTKDISEFKEQAEKVMHFFSQREQNITQWNITANIVEVAIDYQAILNTDFPNGLKKGNHLNIKGRSIFEFKDDLIIKIQDISD